MKKKLIIFLCAAAILLAGIAAWYRAPIDLMNLDPDEVTEITVFNGSTGNTTHIRDSAQIRHIIGHWNDVEVKRTKLSSGYSGYSFRVTLSLSDGSNAEGWNDFIINAEDTIVKDPFFYSVTKGETDYRYLENLTD